MFSLIENAVGVEAGNALGGSLHQKTWLCRIDQHYVGKQASHSDTYNEGLDETMLELYPLRLFTHFNDTRFMLRLDRRCVIMAEWRLFSGEYAWNVFRYRRITVVFDTVHPTVSQWTRISWKCHSSSSAPMRKYIALCYAKWKCATYWIITKLERTAWRSKVGVGGLITVINLLLKRGEHLQKKPQWSKLLLMLHFTAQILITSMILCWIY